MYVIDSEYMKQIMEFKKIFGSKHDNNELYDEFL